MTTRDLTIPNALAQLRRVSDWLVASAGELGVQRELAMRLAVCANEALSNVIRFGYADRDTHLIALRLAVAAGRMTLEIEDDGRPFNPLALPDRSPPPAIGKALLPGIGVRIIRGLLPDSRYECRDGKNILILTSPAAPSAQA